CYPTDDAAEEHLQRGRSDEWHVANRVLRAMRSVLPADRADLHQDRAEDELLVEVSSGGAGRDEKADPRETGEHADRAAGADALARAAHRRDERRPEWRRGDEERDHPARHPLLRDCD